MQNLTQIHLKAKHGLVLRGKLSHFLLLQLGLYGGRREEKNRRREKEDEIQVWNLILLSFEIDIS